MNLHVSGPFDVKMLPEASESHDGNTLGRFGLDKQYRGALEATGRGTMLSAMTGVQDSAGYVAIERVSGTLGGREGSFVLQHSGVMHAGEQQLLIKVVPNSGTGELAGLSGTMKIVIDRGKHTYEFYYSLPD